MTQAIFRLPFLGKNFFRGIVINKDLPFGKDAAYQCRIETDHRTFGDQFYFCYDEINDISFIEALYRTLTLAANQLKNLGTYCEKTASAFIDAVMDTALKCVGLSKNNLAVNPESCVINVINN